VGSRQNAPLFNKGYELRETDANLNRDQSEKIYNSLTQANRAATALARSNIREIFHVDPLTFENRNVVIVPVVVTNAVLRSLNYDRSRVDPSKGEVEEDQAALEDRDWLIFDYPLPNELQIRGPNESGEDIQPIKRPTFIVSSNKVIDIMKAISNDAEDW
jgi:hypothetical protein